MRRVRCLGAAGTLALASASLFAAGAPAVAAAVAAQPASLVSRLASHTQPPTQAQCVKAFTVPCYRPPQFQAALAACQHLLPPGAHVSIHMSKSVP